METLRQCKNCKKFYWNSELEFYAHRHKAKSYHRGDCRKCYNVKLLEARIKSRIKRRLEKELGKAKIRAGMRMLERYPEVLATLISKNPVRYEEFLREEQMKIVKEAKVRSLKFGYRKDEGNAEKILNAYAAAEKELGFSA